MLKREFEELAGYEVSEWDYYRVIEPMYMATTLDKTEFVKTIDKKRFALPTKKQVVNKMKAQANEYKENDEFELGCRLQEMASEYAERFYHINRLCSQHWCFIEVKRQQWTGKIEKVNLCYGISGQINETIQLA